MVYKANFLIFFIPLFSPCLGGDSGVEKPPGIVEILAGMDQISSGKVAEGIQRVRKGRALIFDERGNSLIETLYQASLIEEARGELILANEETGIRRGIHLISAEKLLSLVEEKFPTLESHLLSLQLLKQRGEKEQALKKVNYWLEVSISPFEKAKLLLAKGELLEKQETLLMEALSLFENIAWEGNETQTLRLQLAKIAQSKGDTTGALRLLSKVVNSNDPSPLVKDALSLRADLLDKIGRPDLKVRHNGCGN
jgi:tetratricopeptide (TPR) repeat protein